VANGHGGGGWRAVFVCDGSNHRDSGRAAPGWVSLPRSTPPEVPPCPRGPLFSSNVVSLPGMQDSLYLGSSDSLLTGSPNLTEVQFSR
jgi:hypothetical protein